MVHKVEIIKMIDLGDGKCQVVYDIVDEDYIHPGFNPEDSNINQIYRGSFSCHKDKIKETLSKEVKEALPKYKGKEISMLTSVFEVSEL